jgi:hypothetical protein
LAAAYARYQQPGTFLSSALTATWPRCAATADWQGGNDGKDLLGRRDLMDLFAVAGVLWRHKRVAIPLVLLTVIGIFYVAVAVTPTYQANANVLLVSPPTLPSATQIAQNPSLAKMNNPYANLGSMTGVADVLVALVTSAGSEQSLANAGASPGYQIALLDGTDGSTQPPPALNVTGVGPNPQAAIQTAKLVAAAISRDLRLLQERQQVKSTSMITTVEYITPSSAIKSSSGKLKISLAVAVVGAIVLLVAVSAAEGLEERRNSDPRWGRRPGFPGGVRHDPSSAPTEAPFQEPRWTATRTDDLRSASPAHRRGMQRVGGDES